MQTLKDRLQWLIDREGVTRYRLSQATGISQSTFTRILSDEEGQTTMIRRNIDKVASYFEVSSKWLETGRDDSLQALEENTPHQLTEEELTIANNMGLVLIPEYEEPFRGGNNGEPLLDDGNAIIGYWTLNGIKADMIIPVSGNSMAPTYPAGSRLAVKRQFFRPDEPYSIPFGEIFAFTLKGEAPEDAAFGFVKRLRKHQDPERAHSYWIAHSDNPDYDDFEIRITQIGSLWRVLAGITIGS